MLCARRMAGVWDREPGPRSVIRELDARSCCCCSVAQSCPTLLLLFSSSVLSDSATPWITALRFACPSLSPAVCSSSHPLSWWCRPTIPSSAALFSFGFQSFLASGSFPVSLLFTSSDQSTGASASVSVLPMHAVNSIKQGFYLLDLKLCLCLNKGNTRAAFPKFFQARTAIWVVHLIRQVSLRAAWVRESNPLLHLNSKLTTVLLGRSYRNPRIRTLSLQHFPLCRGLKKHDFFLDDIPYLYLRYFWDYIFYSETSLFLNCYW